MNRAEETALAWALVDSAGTLLTPAARARLWIKIGAGDHDCAIVEMLELYAHGNEDMPTELAHTVDDWMRGYSGADAEPLLRALRDRISVRPSYRVAERPVARPSRRRNGDDVGVARRSKVDPIAQRGLAQA